MAEMTVVTKNEEAESKARKWGKRKVKLWNRSEDDFDQEVNGIRIQIKKGESKIMGRRDALAAKGTLWYCKDPQTGKPNKKLKVRMEIEEVEQMPTGVESIPTEPEVVEKEVEVKVHECPYCDHVAKTKQSLKNHIAQCSKK